MGIDNVLLEDEYPEKFDRLLCGGIWCIVQLDYELLKATIILVLRTLMESASSKQKKQKDISPISIRKLTPIQMPHIDIDELKESENLLRKMSGWIS